MRRRAKTWTIVGLLLAAVLTWTAPEAPGAAPGQSGPGPKPAPGSQGVSGYFIKLDTKGPTRSITIKDSQDRKVKTYPVAQDVALLYRGEHRPWQAGIGTNAFIVLILEKGTVKTINIMHVGS
ncbi:MAG TPA: hypothetical protein VMU60_08950 [Syntrophobacteria bacterium]|nr:hypothetical protein [Syntrophobacteria bacterium]